MLPRVEHAWDLTPREATAFQSTLATQVQPDGSPGLVGCVDIFAGSRFYRGPGRGTGMSTGAHLGLIFDIPTIGCAKSKLSGEHDPLSERRGSVAYLYDSRRWNEISGAAGRTREGTNPVYVSAGHRISLDEAIEWTPRFSPQYRVPMPTRVAHQAAAGENVVRE